MQGSNFNPMLSNNSPMALAGLLLLAPAAATPSAASPSILKAQARLPLPLVTVVVPTCDRPAFVKLALQQIAQQTIENLEVLIVDDTPGRDQSHSYLEGAAVDRLSIRVVRPPTTTQHSIGALRQMAARAATGDIIVHWDDDDMYAPDRIEKQVAPIASGLADLTTLRYSYFLALPAGVFHEVEDGGTFMGSLAYRRSLVDEFEFADVSLGEDLHFADRATSACHTHQIVEGVASVYVRHTGDGDGGRLLRNTARPPSRAPAPAPPARHPLTLSFLPPASPVAVGRPPPPGPSLVGVGPRIGLVALPRVEHLRRRREGARLRHARTARGIRGGRGGDGVVGGALPDRRQPPPGGHARGDALPGDAP